jgi:hypothetical protein
MPPQLTLTFTDERGQTNRINVNTPRFHIGRSPDNELTITDSNLSRRHALIEIHADAAYLSDLRSQNGTTIGDRPVTGSVKLNDGDTITLGNARRLHVSINQSPAALYDVGQANPQPASAHVIASHAVAPPGDSSALPSATPVWLSPPALAAAGVALIVVCAAIILLFSLGNSDAENTQATNADDPLAAAIADELADESAAGNTNLDAVSTSSTKEVTSDVTPASNVNTDTSATTSPDGTLPATPATTDTSADSTLSPEEQTARLAKRVLSRISTDNTPYISAAGISDVQRQIETYRNSASLAARLNSTRKSCTEIAALARTNNLKPSLVTLAALAQSETGGGDPAATAREMMPKLLTLRATFGTETANSTLLLVAAYPYPFDPRLGSQTRTAHPLASKLMQYGGKGSTVDTAVARSVWFLREQNGITPEAYALVVRLIAIGVIAQDPSRYGVAAEPLLC